MSRRRRLRNAARDGRWLLRLAAAAVFGAVGAIGLHSGGIHPVRIASRSMAPAITPGEWIVVRDLGPGGRGRVRRGDVVLFRFPLGTKGRAVKRVVGVAGDRVSIGPDAVVVGDRVIHIAGAPGEYARGPRKETVPGRHVFVVGDNAAVSIDSRSFGALPTREIVAAQLLVLGDTTRVIALALVSLCAFAGAGVVSVVALRRRRVRLRSADGAH